MYGAQALTTVPCRSLAWRLAVPIPQRPYLVVVTFVMASGSIVLFEPAPYDIALVLLLAVGVISNRLAFHASQRLPVALLAGFIAANFVSAPNAINGRTALLYSLVNFYVAGSWLFFAGFTSKYGYRGVCALMNGYMVGGVFSAVLATLSYLRLIPFQSILLRYGRAQAFFKDPNVYGPYLVPIILFTLVTLLRTRLFSRGFLIALTICLVSTVGVFLSFSRACWLNTAAGIACLVGLQTLYGLRMRAIQLGMLRIFLGIGALGGTTVFFIGGSGTETRTMLLERVGNNGLHDYDAVRFGTQRRALDSALAQPLGIGTRQSELVFDYATHNMYLRVLAENGILGFACFSLFILLSLMRSAKLALTLENNRWRDFFAVLTSCLAGVLVNGFVIDTIRWRHFWLLLGLAWCTPLVSSRTLADAQVSANSGNCSEARA